MKLSEMRQVLAERSIRLTKSLGQNFLHDANQLRRIMAAAEVQPVDQVLEIGPGLGPLTELLMQTAGKVLAIEKDARLVEVLRRRFGLAAATGPGADSAFSADPRARAVLELIQDDALEYLGREARDWSEWKLVSNLPYSLASPILVELAQGRRSPHRIVATLQLEVARRLMAKPGDADYGLLTLLVQIDFEPREWFKIPASCFFPEPDVDSACVSLARRPQALVAPQARAVFARLVKRAFSQRRKMMLKLLRQDWPADRLAQACAQALIPPTARAESVSLQQFAGLASALSETG